MSEAGMKSSLIPKEVGCRNFGGFSLCTALVLLGIIWAAKRRTIRYTVEPPGDYRVRDLWSSTAGTQVGV